jgi:hypothetical protein
LGFEHRSGIDYYSWFVGSPFSPSASGSHRGPSSYGNLFYGLKTLRGTVRVGLRFVKERWFPWCMLLSLLSADISTKLVSRDNGILPDCVGLLKCPSSSPPRVCSLPKLLNIGEERERVGLLLLNVFSSKKLKNCKVKSQRKAASFVQFDLTSLQMHRSFSMHASGQDCTRSKETDAKQLPNRARCERSKPPSKSRNGCTSAAEGKTDYNGWLKLVGLKAFMDLPGRARGIAS